MNKEIIAVFEKIGYDGVSIGKYNKKKVFAWGILPGEKAKIRITKKRRNFIQGELLEVLEKSSHRKKELEAHYLSCSPWQTFDYNYQIELKKNLLQEIYLKFAKTEIQLENFFPSQKKFGYRTKIEYSFMEENEKQFFAFYKRENFREKIKLIDGCKLMSEHANRIAYTVLEEINKQKIKDLKTLIIRKSQRYKDMHVSLLTWNRNQKFNFENKGLSGFSFVYSRKESPASTFDEILQERGLQYLREKILELEVKYHYTSFFQNNIELFEKALQIMRENSQTFEKIVDLYAGVGVIGLALADFGKEILSIEIDKTATEYAEANAESNDIKNFRAVNLASEKIPLEILEKTDLLILDPPRSGLHKKVIKLILKTKPKNIFYLSCNPVTQARDFSFLKEKYNAKKFYGFDFYPNTPHIEAFLHLQLKAKSL